MLLTFLFSEQVSFGCAVDEMQMGLSPHSAKPFDENDFDGKQKKIQRVVLLTQFLNHFIYKKWKKKKKKCWHKLLRATRRRWQQKQNETKKKKEQK